MAAPVATIPVTTGILVPGDLVDSSHCMSDHDAIVIVNGDPKAM